MPTYLLDVNVLIALAWPTHVHHARAHAWLDGVDEWATTPVTESAFVRLSTNRAVVGAAVPVAVAVSMLSAIRAAPGHRFLTDGASFADPSIDLSRVATSAQITDAHLVGLAAGARFVLATMDEALTEMLAPADRRHVLLLPG
ncbi:TA system VapC family ribonuclease toxin [Microbacterium sp. BWT-B31]|uniref:TA system VapC family ribonuclease toxin n=1 Tax=Microbacterium sp. BWT-B31 TaxID=3232072 RepID=UPI003527378C